jgi:hypothetical protein
MNLTIYINDNGTVAGTVSEEHAPELFAAFREWQDAEQASHEEAGAWERVLQTAAEYLSETGDYMDADGDVEVSDVTWFE